MASLLKGCTKRTQLANGSGNTYVACALFEAWIQFAFVNIIFTEFSRPARQTGTCALLTGPIDALLAVVGG